MSERLSVELRGPVSAKLATLIRRTGRNKTYVVNRALELLQFIEEEQSKGKKILIRDKSGKEQEIKLI